MANKQSSSKYRKQLKEVLSSDDKITDIDLLVNDNKTTYKAVYECLHYGLTVAETFFIIETHREISFNPSIKSLRILYFFLEKDSGIFLESVDLLEEHSSLFKQEDGPDVEWYRRGDRAIFEFKKMFKNHNYSIDSLKMHLESFESDGDEDEDEEESYS